MARGTTLINLLTDLRAETRSSMNVAHNVQVRDMQMHILQRTQERLWGDFDWPHLRVKVELPIQSGQRYYRLPVGLSIDRLESIHVFADGVWMPLPSGIGSERYAVINSDLDQRGYPPRRWEIKEDEILEIWPVPNQTANATTRNGFLQFTGIRNLKPLVDNGDQAELDDRLIVLFAAAELLAGNGAKDAGLKLDMAKAHYARLRAGLMPRQSFQMFGVNNDRPRRRSVITNYRPAGS